MATHNLTDTLVKNLKAGDCLYRERDKLVKGLHIAVSPDGNKGWALQYTSPTELKADGTKQRRFYGIGTYPDVRIADARKKALALKELITQGIDPREQDSERKQAQKVESEGKLKNLLNLYVRSLRDRGAASADIVENSLSLHLSDKLLNKPADPDTAGGVGESDILKLLRDVKERAQGRRGSGERAADLVRAYMNAAYTFILKARNSPKWSEEAVAFKNLRVNPVQYIHRYQSSTTPGKRVLSIDEVKYLWNHTGVDVMPRDIGLYLKLSLTTGGQRVMELLHSEWNEFDFDENVWAIPMSRRKIRHKAKHREPHLVPLTPMAIELLKELRELSHGKFLFPGRTGKAPKSPFALNQSLRRFCMPREGSNREQFKLFSGRDLRRTWKTLSGQAGLSKEIRDRVQGHSFSDVSAVHYDRYSYWPEKLEAMNRWCNWLDELVTGRKSDKVVPIRGGAA